MEDGGRERETCWPDAALVERETTIDFLGDCDVILVCRLVAVRLAIQIFQVVVEVEELVIAQRSQIKHLSPSNRQYTEYITPHCRVTFQFYI